MPSRKADPELEYIIREYGADKTITKTRAQWKESDKRITKITKWNEEIKVLCKDLQKELREEHRTDAIDITPDRYRKVVENQGGFDKFVPRNYLSFEVIRVVDGANQVNYYFGRFNSVKQLVETLKQDSYDRRKEANKNSRSSRSNTDKHGVGFKERRFQRDPKEGGESNDDLQG